MANLVAVSWLILWADRIYWKFQTAFTRCQAFERTSALLLKFTAETHGAKGTRKAMCRAFKLGYLETKHFLLGITCNCR